VILPLHQRLQLLKTTRQCSSSEALKVVFQKPGVTASVRRTGLDFSCIFFGGSLSMDEKCFYNNNNINEDDRSSCPRRAMQDPWQSATLAESLAEDRAAKQAAAAAVKAAAASATEISAAQSSGMSSACILATTVRVHCICFLPLISYYSLPMFIVFVHYAVTFFFEVPLANHRNQTHAIPIHYHHHSHHHRHQHHHHFKQPNTHHRTNMS
jgi:hypothetical protein